MNEAEKIAYLEKFHEYVFGKNPGVAWSHMKQSPAQALEAILTIGSSPTLQTMETGFLLGSVLLFGMEHDALAVRPMLDAMRFKLQVNKNGRK